MRSAAVSAVVAVAALSVLLVAHGVAAAPANSSRRALAHFSQASNSSTAPNCSTSARLIATALDARDPTVDPCDSFFQYACGAWLKSTAMPADQLKYSRSFSTIKARNQRAMRHIFESDEPLLTPFYRSCLNQSTINRAAVASLIPYLQLFSPALPSVTDYFHSLGLLSRNLLMQPLLSLEVEVDSSDPQHQWLAISQPTLSLPTLKYYSNGDTTALLAGHIQRMMQLLGQSPQSAAKDAVNVLTVETLLANISLPPVRMREPLARYNPTNLSSLQQLAPHVAWSALFTGLSLPVASVRMNAVVPSFLSSLSSSLLSLPGSAVLPLLSSYTRWRIVHLFAQDLPEPFQREDFEFFNARLHGQKRPMPRWQYCVDRTVQHMTELSGVRYQQRTFTAAKRAAAVGMIERVKAALRHKLTGVQWMDETTRRGAVSKLDEMIDNIGGPGNASVPDYHGVWLSADSYLDNVLRLRRFDADRTFSRLLQRTDRTRWEMPAPESNAYYEPTTNRYSRCRTLLTGSDSALRRSSHHALLSRCAVSINFPAGILQPPFFSEAFPAAANYGGLGMIVGHEMSHSLDDEGRHYDGSGALRNWSSLGGAAAFDAHSSCLERQYSNLTVKTCHGNEHINGRLTLGENIADNVGLSAAYQAWRDEEPVEGAAGEAVAAAVAACMQPALNSSAQLFFVSFAAGWCQLIRPEFAHTQLQVDVHAPAVARVNGPLQNSPEFAAAFDCSPGSAMNPARSTCQLY